MPHPHSLSAPTAACLLTGQTRAAVATVAVAGAAAQQILEQVFEPAAAGAVQPGQVRYGLWVGGVSRGAAAESVVISHNPRRDAGDRGSSWEVHCHGGVAAAERILGDLRELDAVVLSGDQWLAWQGEPLLQREARQVLSHTPSQRTAGIALDQLRGAMAAWAEPLLQRLSAQQQAALPAIVAAAKQRLQLAPLGQHLTQPWRVVLAGAPNVGKSSLINALLGYRRSITLDQPGTTRDVVEAQTVIDGWPVQLSDTAGIHDAALCEIETVGIQRAQQELAQADLVLWVRDARELATAAAAQAHQATSLPTGAGTLPAEGITSPVENATLPAGNTTLPAGKRVLNVINKIDLIDAAALPAGTAIATAATRSEGIESLRQRIAAALVPVPPSPGDAVPITARQNECLQQLAAATDVPHAHTALLRLLGSAD